MSEVETKKAIAGTITCKPGEAALLPVDKVKLHYVVHYLHRGAFDRWVPEAESEEEKLRAFSAAKLLDLKGVDSAELKQFLGYSWVRLGKERARCLTLWKAARALDSKLPLPKPYLEAYAEAYDTKQGLDELP